MNCLLCPKPRHARGLCSVCYARTSRLVSQGFTNEAAEIAASRLLPSQQKPRARWARGRKSR